MSFIETSNLEIFFGIRLVNPRSAISGLLEEFRKTWIIMTLSWPIMLQLDGIDHQKSCYTSRNTAKHVKFSVWFLVDMWSVGCILAELFGRKVFLPGSSGFEQLHLILQKLGTPDEETLNSIPSNKAKVYISKLPKYEKISLSKRFPNISQEGLNLLERLLEFSPEKRITAEEALNHSYLSSLHEYDCSIQMGIFDFSFDKTCTTLLELRST